MKTWLCTTLVDIYGLTQGAARLYAYLKRDKHDITLKDYNHDAYFALLSRENLECVMQKLNHDTEAQNKDMRERIGVILSKNSDGSILQLLKKAVGNKLNNEDILDTLLDIGEFVINEVDEASHVLDREFFTLQPEEFLVNYRTLLCGKAIIDAAYYPAKLDFGFGFTGTAYGMTASDIINATADHDHNFTLSYFQNIVVPEFIQEHPSVVGISITCPDELIPALTLARIIKTADPTTHICLGGASLPALSYRLVKNVNLWELFDSLVVGPGESAFGELIDHLEGGKDLSGVPNLFYKKGTTVKESEKTQEFDINDTCTPDYGDVRPGSIVSLETASACYWGKCIFCNYPGFGTSSGDSAFSRKRVRNIDLVLQDIDQLTDKYNPGFIAFTDSSMHPKRMEAIVDYNNSKEKKIKFAALIRLEKQFKSPDFCRKLADGGFISGQVGLESGSQRINNIINKGIDLNDSEEIIKNLHQAGVLIHLFCIIGTPGETREDADMTYDFIKRRHKELTLGWDIYNLLVFEHGPLHKRAQEFGMTTTPLPDEYLNFRMKYSVAEGLSQNESLGISLRFANQLEKYFNPLHNMLDIESLKLFLSLQKARGFSQEEIIDIYVRTKNATIDK